MVHIVCCVITMSRIISRCAQHFYCTSYKQCNQSHFERTNVNLKVSRKSLETGETLEIWETLETLVSNASKLDPDC